MSVPEKHRAVAHAFVDGADVDCRPTYSLDWIRDPDPDWIEDWEYRVAPKKVKKWRWVAETTGGCLFITEYRYADQADYTRRTQGLSDILIQRIDRTEREVEE